MKRMMLLEENQDTFECPVCKKDRFHRYTQMFYNIHWCESCENYFTIDKKDGKRYVYLLNESETKSIRKTKSSKLSQKTKDLKYILEKRNRQKDKQNIKKKKSNKKLTDDEREKYIKLLKERNLK